MNISVGRSGFSLVAVAATQELGSSSGTGQLRAEFVMIDDIEKEYYRMFETQRMAIDEEFGMGLEWLESPGKKQSKICIRRSVDLYDRKQWSDYQAWLLAQFEKLHQVFAKRVRLL